MRSLTGFLSRWRLLQCLCLVLVSSTILFSTSIESKASSGGSASNSSTFSGTLLAGNARGVRQSDLPLDLSCLNDLSVGQYYLVNYSGNLSISQNVSCSVSTLSVNMDFAGVDISLINSMDVLQGKTFNLPLSGSFVYKAVENPSVTYDYSTFAFSQSSSSTFKQTHTLNFNIDSFEAISSGSGDEYQNGYNAGYSAGESAGYGNGYSNGFADGEASVDTDKIYDEAFQAGKDSVDTDSYYDSGYQEGYQVAYSAGYSNGFSEGLKSAQDSPGEWQWYKFIGSPVSDVKKYGSSFYIAPYGLDDMEEYQNGSNGYYHNTVPSVYDGYSTINYLIPFDDVTVIDADSFLVELTLSNLISGFDIDTGSGSFQNSLVSSEVQEVYITFNGRKYYGNIGKYTSGSQGYVNFKFIVDDVIPPVELSSNCMALTFVVHNTMFANIKASQYKFVGASCSPYVSFNVGATAQGYALRVRPFIKNDRVSANIQDQTDKITGSLDDQKEIQQGQLEEQKEQTETQKGIASSIKEFFGSFFDNLINSIIHVIVPTKEEMGELFNRLNDFFAETFGFLYYPFDFIIDAFNIFLEADSETGLTLPGFSIMGYEVWGNQTYDITSEPVVGQIFGYVRMGTGAVLAMWFVNYLRNFFDKRFGGGGN